MRDVKGFAEHFRFVPEHHGQGGVCMTPFMGEVAPGRIYTATDPARAAALAGHPEWEKVTKKEYDAQCKADQKEQADDE